MKALSIDLELRDEVVISERAASEGGHRCLDYIPGANLLGAAAARLYPELAKADAWTLFHSGKVRFGNALPLTSGGLLARPMPLCWHESKAGERAVRNGHIQADSLIDLLHGVSGRNVQPRQLRGGYVAEDGEVIKPRRILRMKTAIDPVQGRAAEAQLFGYEAIAAGTLFRATISADDDVSQDLLDQLRDSLNGNIRVGRSRSAQYGGITARPGAWASGEVKAEAATGLVLWLQADLALANKAGASTLVPEAELLGLPAGVHFQPARSFVRFRRYSPYNNARQGHDVERQVIVQGSVLCYELKSGVSLAAGDLIRLVAGIGLYREAGLGQVLVNPALLREAKPVFTSPPEQRLTPESPPRPKHPLAVWLEAQGGGAQARAEAQRWAETKVDELREHYRHACAYNGLLACQIAGPGRSQWGRVEEAAKQGAANLESALFEGNDAICKSGDEDWGNTRFGPNPTDTYAVWLRSRFDEARQHSDTAYRLALLADQAQKLVGRLGQGEPE